MKIQRPPRLTGRERSARSRRWFTLLVVAVPLSIVAMMLLYYRHQAEFVPILNARILHVYQHGPNDFTEGLAVCDGRIIESDGLYGGSRLVVRTLPYDRTIRQRRLPASVFGEGVTCVGNTLIQLTWRRGLAYYYADPSLRLVAVHHYSGQGWGLTAHGDQLIMSNGTNHLRVLQAKTMQLLRTINVHADGNPVWNLNELEWVRGRIFANVWRQNRIAVIDPKSGSVLAWIDCSRLSRIASLNRRSGHDGVLNGIAFDHTTGRLYVTGKDWPDLFEIAVPSLP